MEYTVLTVSFVEMVFAKTSKSTNSQFDIILDETITTQNYCNGLLNKFFELPLSNYSDFINYQINLLVEPCKWLNKLEKLICRNEELFISKKALFRCNKIFHLIEKKQLELQSSSVPNINQCTPKKYINAENEDRHFSFYELKKELATILCDNEKIIILTKEQFEYQQTNIDFINQKIPFYDDQCRKEIKQIYALQKLKTDFESGKPIVNSNYLQFNKMQFNGNINQLVDVFYQLHRELFVDGKSYIDGNTNDLISWIVNTFVDKDGNEISPLTVETILKPSRGDKRPKPHKRIDIDKML
jgi:hypothetical protein